MAGYFAELSCCLRRATGILPWKRQKRSKKLGCGSRVGGYRARGGQHQFVGPLTCAGLARFAAFAEDYAVARADRIELHAKPDQARTQ